jgi:hypothetical protein
VHPSAISGPVSWESSFKVFYEYLGTHHSGDEKEEQREVEIQFHIVIIINKIPGSGKRVVKVTIKCRNTKNNTADTAEISVLRLMSDIQ